MIEFNSIVVFTHGTPFAEFSGDAKLKIDLTEEQANAIRQICWDAFEANKQRLADTIRTSSQPLLCNFTEVEG